MATCPRTDNNRLIRDFLGQGHENVANQEPHLRLLGNTILKTAEAENVKDEQDRLSHETQIKSLMRKLQELADARQEVNRELPVEVRTKAERIGDHPLALNAMVENLTFTWLHRKWHAHDTIGARIKSAFHGFTGSLNQHFVLLELAPSNNEYVSIIFGSLKFVLQAAQNYQTIAQSLPAIMDELSALNDEVVGHARRLPRLDLHRQIIVATFFTGCFRLFAKLIKWCTQSSWRRIRASARKDSASVYQDDLTVMRRNCEALFRATATQQLQDLGRKIDAKQSVHEEAVWCGMTGMGVNALSPQETPCSDRVGVLAIEEDNSTETGVPGQGNNSLHNDLGRSGYTNMQETPAQVQDCREEIMRQLAEASSKAASKEVEPVTDDLQDATHCQVFLSEPVNHIQIKSDVLRAARKLENWYPPGHVALGTIAFAHPDLDDILEPKLTAWLKQPGSRTLYIEAHDSPSEVPLSTQIAACATDIADEKGYSLLSYFCSLPLRVESGRSLHTMALCELASSLLHQALELLPEELPASAPAFNIERFASLSNTLTTWPAMLGILRGVLEQANRPLIVVLDGLECLDDQYTLQALQGLLAVFQRRAMLMETKLLLTTNDCSMAVAGCIATSETLTLEETTGALRAAQLDSADF